MKQTTICSIISGISLGTVVISGSLAMMTNVSADDLPSIDDNITITVDSACTMGQTVTSSHTTELNPGETNNAIGQSRIAAYCNDNEGYAIYAIGYTNSEYGNTNLVSTDGNHTIPTGTSGSNSYWNMRLTQGTATGPTSYLPTMVNEFTTNATIPNDYTKVAYRDSSTISQNQDPTETGSYFTTTYSAHIDTTQPAGIYNGQVQYVMVHPASAPAPEKPNIGQLTYMQDFATLSEEEKNKLINNTEVGVQYTLKDRRDEKEYYVSKLADGNVWMTQNLDLDIVAGKTYTSEDTDLTHSSIGTTWKPNSSTRKTNTTTWGNNRFILESYDPGNRYWDGTISIYGGTIESMPTSGNPHYHIGNYYNWTAAVAMNDSGRYMDELQEVNQSICPAGWRLPIYSNNKSYHNLVEKQKLISGTSGNIQDNPTNLIYGGGWSGYSYNVNSYGVYWTSIVQGPGGGSITLNFEANGNLETQESNYRGTGHAVRCVNR